jgi:hypothetical protein
VLGQPARDFPADRVRRIYGVSMNIDEVNGHAASARRTAFSGHS